MMRIAIVTGSRADRGPLEEVFHALDAWRVANPFSPVSLRWIDVTPAAYKPNFGSEAVQVAAAAATQVSGELAAIPTDLVVLHGDRYEILGAAMGANMMGIPIAHLAGGDVTEGSADDCYRNAITKLSHLHFPNCWESFDRIIQMGEEPSRVHMVGDPAVDRILRTPIMERVSLLKELGFTRFLTRDNPEQNWSWMKILVVLLHPSLGDQGEELEALLGALRAIDGNVAMVLIGPNADPGHKRIELEWQLLASARPNTVYHENLDGDVFMSLLKHCDCLVGNSSAAFYEAPIFGTSVVDIGDRQKGRRMPVGALGVWVPTEYSTSNSIAIAIKYSMDMNRVQINMGDGCAAERIADIIGKIGDPKPLIRKRFQTIDMGRRASAEAVGNLSE